MYLRICSIVVILMAAPAQAAECPEVLGCCDVACYQKLFNEPSERLSYPIVLQADELRKDSANYLGGTTYADVTITTLERNSLTPIIGQEVWVYRQPRVTPDQGAPFRWKCEIRMTALPNGKTGGSAYACPVEPDCLRRDDSVTLSIEAQLKRGQVRDNCRLPL